MRNSQNNDAPAAIGTLATALAGLLPRGAAVCVKPITKSASAFSYDVEREAVAGAVEARQREFVTGRACARSALIALGWRGGPIPAGKDRAPLWPPGYVGSITHAAGCAAAVAARTPHVLSIGIDVEANTPLSAAVEAMVLNDDDCPLHVARIAGKLVFVAKEAVYKAYYPRVGAFLDFSDVSVAFDVSRWGRFEAHLRNANLPPLCGLRRLEGCWTEAGGRLAALLILQSDGPELR